MIVVCLNAHDYLGRGDEYVSKLRNMVARNLTVPYEFVCLTEKDFESGEGWWLKLDILRMFDGLVMYFDLDVVITSNIDHLVDLAESDPSRLWARDDFSYSRRNPRQWLSADFLLTLGGPGTINSSVMLWHGRRNVPRLYGAHGDQNCITAALWPDGIGFLPDESVKSYKYHPGQIAPVVVFHGEPKNHQVTDGWVRDHWR